MSEIRTYARYNYLIIVLGLAGIAFGVLCIVSKPSAEAPECQNAKGMDKDGIDVFNTFVFTMGMGGVLTGALTSIGGCLGSAGGFSKKVNPILASVGLVALVMPFAIMLTILGFGIGSSIEGECDNRKCDGLTKRCNSLGCTDVGVGTQDCLGWCQNDYDRFCEELPPYFTGIAVVFASVFAASIPSCICGCGAACACPDRYKMFDDEKDMVGNTTYGLPASNSMHSMRFD